MTKTGCDSWSRLARAAADARDDLRLFIPQLDRAITATGDPSGLLTRAKELAWIHADRLRLALKHPDAVGRGQEVRR